MELTRSLLKKAIVDVITSCYENKIIIYIVLAFIANDKETVDMNLLMNKFSHR